MAKLVYDEWFVKFRFPGYENVKMVPSDLGEIPEGWEVKILHEVVEIKYGLLSQKIFFHTKCRYENFISCNKNKGYN